MRMEKKLSASFLPAVPPVERGNGMSKKPELKRVKPNGKATEEQLAELKALAEVPDDQIDLSDIPEITDWSGAVVGKFYRPVKVAVTVRLDADVVHWLKRDG